MGILRLHVLGLFCNLLGIVALRALIDIGEGNFVLGAVAHFALNAFGHVAVGSHIAFRGGKAGEGEKERCGKRRRHYFFHGGFLKRPGVLRKKRARPSLDAQGKDLRLAPADGLPPAAPIS
jgi:hypothetical protein